ncbi:hypothetical protein CTZ27_28305 [Streptomyces griseocarneus]|nr:hypothetical protein CTZ27_28305 [Streptomyces griseocarneus]
MVRQRILAMLAVFAAMASIVVGVAPVAQAAAVDVSCVGTTQVTWSPGLRLQPQEVHFTETDLYTNCTSSDPTLQTGSALLSGDTDQVTCLKPLHAGTFHNVITWSNGQTSDILTTFAANSSGGVITLVGNGVVVNGEFKGDSAKMVYTYAQPSVTDCLSPGGLTRQFGTATVTINGS